MKRARHSEAQIIAVPQEAQAGSIIEELCHRHGISAATCYKWKQKFGGLEVKDGQRMRLLEEENRKLKQLVGWWLTRPSTTWSGKNCWEKILKPKARRTVLSEVRSPPAAFAD